MSSQITFDKQSAVSSISDEFIIKCYYLERVPRVMTEHTPESELGSIECFQNYTASEVFIQGLAGIVDQQDVESMIRAQKQMLQRFEKTNEMLINCNNLCTSRLKTASQEFKKHASMLSEMKKDLDNIYKRIHNLKMKTQNQYPAEYAKSEKLRQFEESANPDDTESTHQDEPEPLRRANSSSSESGGAAAGGGSQNDSSPYTSDTG